MLPIVAPFFGIGALVATVVLAFTASPRRGEVFEVSIRDLACCSSNDIEVLDTLGLPQVDWAIRCILGLQSCLKMFDAASEVCLSSPILGDDFVTTFTWRSGDHNLGVSYIGVHRLPPPWSEVSLVDLGESCIYGSKSEGELGEAGWIKDQGFIHPSPQH